MVRGAGELIAGLADDDVRGHLRWTRSDARARGPLGLDRVLYVRPVVAKDDEAPIVLYERVPASLVLPPLRWEVPSDLAVAEALGERSIVVEAAIVHLGVVGRESAELVLRLVLLFIGDVVDHDVLRVAGAEEVVALVGAGAAVHAGVHVDLQAAVLAEQFTGVDRHRTVEENRQVGNAAGALEQENLVQQTLCAADGKGRHDHVPDG